VLGAAEHSKTQQAVGALLLAIEYLSRRGEPRAAKVAAERALATSEALYGPEHPQVATALSSLGVVLGQLGDPVRARAAFERALAIKEAVYGPNHPEVAGTLTNLGDVLEELGDLAGEQAARERALAMDEAAGLQSKKSMLHRARLQTPG